MSLRDDLAAARDGVSRELSAEMVNVPNLIAALEQLIDVRIRLRLPSSGYLRDKPNAS